MICTYELNNHMKNWIAKFQTEAKQIEPFETKINDMIKFDPPDRHFHNFGASISVEQRY